MSVEVYVLLNWEHDYIYGIFSSLESLNDGIREWCKETQNTSELMFERVEWDYNDGIHNIIVDGEKWEGTFYIKKWTVDGELDL